MAETTLTAEATPEDTSSGTWRESLPEEYRDSGTLKDIPDVSTLAKSYIDAQSFIGRSIRIPGEDAAEDVVTDFRERLAGVDGVGYIPTQGSSDDDWNTFYGKLGRPAQVEDYDIQRPENLPGDENVERGFLERMHKLGLNNNQASGLINWMNDGQVDINQRLNQDQESAVSNLKEEWGQAYDKKLEDARRALNLYGDEGLVEMLENTGLGDSPAMIKAFAKVGENLSEDAAVNVDGERAHRVTPAEALTQIGEITGNRAHPYNDDKHPSHQLEVERVARLYQAAYPSEGEQGEFEKRFESAFNEISTG